MVRRTGTRMKTRGDATEGWWTFRAATPLLKSTRPNGSDGARRPAASAANSVSSRTTQQGLSEKSARSSWSSRFHKAKGSPWHAPSRLWW